jgi:hypothetical protein
MLALGCYAPELHDCTVECTRAADCASGQMCGSDGWCARPEAAGRCARLSSGDGGIVPPGDSAGSDAPTDAGIDADPDSGACTAACTKGICDHGVCVIDCSLANSCNSDIVCPPGAACRVVCGDKACAHHITCPAQQACEVQCSGALSCGDQIYCGTADCNVTCSGYMSCRHKINCGSACACDVACTGTQACPDVSVCPAMACVAGHGCSSAPNTCNTCP